MINLKVKVDNWECTKYLFINNHSFENINVFYKLPYACYAGISNTYFDFYRGLSIVAW